MQLLRPSANNKDSIVKNALTVSLLLASASLFAPAAAFAKHHEEAAPAITDPAMAAILNADIRKDDKARDIYRHPGQTLAFMGLAPGMTVGEYAPSGGWYTRVIAPYVAEKGKYVGLFFNPAPLPFPDEGKAKIRADAAAFAGEVAKWTGLPAEKFAGYTTDAFPEDLKGSMDFIFIPRMLHNMIRWNVADHEIKALRSLLKDNGMIGIEQHRAKADAPYSYTDGNMGYLRQADVVKFMEINGFELVKSAEINANSKDTADYETGVWTLPPALRTSKDDAASNAKYIAIGESDRMTLLFKKRP
jgi:predicted methyltransferase